MKYIVFAINYPTLCRALRYIDTQWGKENSILMYATLVSPLPEGLVKDYDVIEIAGHNRGRIGGLKALFADALTANRSWHQLRKLVKDTQEEFTLVVFRDNEAPEATIIEKAARHFPKRFHLWIIEEGTGLYRTDRPPIQGVWLKKRLFRLLGISTYDLKSVSQGEHPKVEKVICQQPEWAAEKFAGKDIAQQIPVFVPEFNPRFAAYVLGAAPESSCFDFVFLTTPCQDIATLTDNFYENYGVFLENLTRHASGSKLLIKCHPRDTYDYQKYTQIPNVKVCSSLENQVPFECLYAYYGFPKVISLGSSFTLDNPDGKPTIFAHKLLGLPASIESLMSKYTPEMLVLCETMEDLEKALTK